MKPIFRDFYDVQDAPKTKAQRRAWGFYYRLQCLLVDEIDKYNDYTHDMAVELLEILGAEADSFAREIKEEQK